MKKILVSIEPWQTRAAVVEDGLLRDLTIGSAGNPELERSFIKGKILKVLPGIQTAFVEIGQARSGFLHVTEVDRTLASERIFESQDTGDEKPRSNREIRDAMDIGKIFTEGDSVLVQVTKEPVFEKGAKLTTCFTLPGKFVVLMPNIAQLGISRKIESKDERARLRGVVEAALPAGMGAIIRTTAEERPAKDIERDIKFLVAIWTEIQKKFAQAAAGETVYEDVSVALRAVREHLDEDIDIVFCDDKVACEEMRTFVKQFMPERLQVIQLYSSKQPLLEKFGVEAQIGELLNRKVHLKSGGTLIIESTEAMTVIDVNTGRFVGKTNLEDTIFKTNLEAAEEVVRQLRLRNIGGLIVIDFIDMVHIGNRQKLSRLLEKTLHEKDKLQSVALKVSEFGLVQMTRKRTGRTLANQILSECPMCLGNGSIKSVLTRCCEVLRRARQEVVDGAISGKIELFVPLDLFEFFKTTMYQSLLAFEVACGIKLVLVGDVGLHESTYRIVRVK